jgi:hypothetical protein
MKIKNIFAIFVATFALASASSADIEVKKYIDLCPNFESFANKANEKENIYIKISHAGNKFEAYVDSQTTLEKWDEAVEIDKNNFVFLNHSEESDCITCTYIKRVENQLPEFVYLRSTNAGNKALKNYEKFKYQRKNNQILLNKC